MPEVNIQHKVPQAYNRRAGDIEDCQPAKMNQAEVKRALNEYLKKKGLLTKPGFRNNKRKAT